MRTFALRTIKNIEKMQETVKKVLSGDFNRKKALMFLLTALLTICVWNLPISYFCIDGLTVVQQRVIAIFVMAVMLWLTEAIPAWATSVSSSSYSSLASPTQRSTSCKAPRESMATCWNNKVSWLALSHLQSFLYLITI